MIINSKQYLRVVNYLPLFFCNNLIKKLYSIVVIKIYRTMANKRKYPEVVGYWVYSIKIPSINKYYIGISKCKKCSRRWQKSLYKGMALEPYLNEWQDMIKTVLIDGLTKEEAYKYEDNIIRALSMNDLCINERRSGLIEVSDKNAYQREFYKNNAEYQERVKQQNKQWREDNREQYNEYMKEYMKQLRLKKKLEQTSLQQ